MQIKDDENVMQMGRCIGSMIDSNNSLKDKDIAEKLMEIIVIYVTKYAEGGEA